MTREKLMDLEITPSGSTNMDSMSGMSGSTSSMGGMSALAGGSTSSGGSALTDAAGQEVSGFRLGDVATIEETVSLGSIQREQQRRCVTVTAEVAEGYNVTKVTAAAQTAVAGVDLPQGITARFSGENEAIMDAMGQLLLMLGLGVLLVLRPGEGAQALTMLLGASLFLDGVMNLLVALLTVKIIRHQQPDVIETDEFEIK